MPITLHKGGYFTLQEWDGEKGEYISTNIPIGQEITLLMENCVLEEGVTLRDIFTVLKAEISIYGIIINNYVEDIIAEGLEVSIKQVEDIEYLELYWAFEDSVIENKRVFNGHFFPAFHGVSPIRDKNVYYTKYKDIMCKKGERIYYSLVYTAINEIIDIPIKLSKAASVYRMNYDETKLKNTKIKPIIYDECPFSLFSILYGIIWELAWAGSPENKREKVKELQDIIDAELDT